MKKGENNLENGTYSQLSASTEDSNGTRSVNPLLVKGGRADRLAYYEHVLKNVVSTYIRNLDFRLSSLFPPLNCIVCILTVRVYHKIITYTNHYEQINRTQIDIDIW